MLFVGCSAIESTKEDQKTTEKATTEDVVEEDENETDPVSEKEETNPETSESTESPEVSQIEEDEIDDDMDIQIQVDADDIPEIEEPETTTTTKKPAKEKCEVAIHVDYLSNIAMAKYSVVVLFDGDEMATIGNGEEYLGSVVTNSGHHTLRFEKLGESSFCSYYSFDIDDDSTVECSLKTHLDEIEVRDQKVSVGAVSMDAEVPDVVGLRLNIAREKLGDAGFMNISATASKMIIVENNWLVVDINVQPGEKVNKSTEIILYCEKDG